MQPTRKYLVAVSLILATSSFAGSAHAIDPEGSATELRAGYALKQDGKCGEAVAHFQRSHDLDPAKPKPLLNLADCEQRLGDLVGAREHFVQGRDLARHANDDELVAAATEQLAGVERRLPHLIIRLEATAPAASIVTLDGATVESSRLGVPEAVNPGKHMITARAPGWTDKSVELPLGEGASQTIEVAPLGLPANPYVPPSPLDAKEMPSTWDAREIASLGVSGVGVVAIGIGSAFGVIAISNKNASNANGHCDATGCDPTGKSLRNAALGDATASSWLIGLGLAAIAGGVALYVTAPTVPTRSTAHVEVLPLAGPSLTGLGMKGVW